MQNLKGAVRAISDNPSRRRLLAGATAALAAGAAIATAARGAPVVSPGADDALIDACQAFIAWEERVLALYTGATRIEDDDEREAALVPLEAQQRPLVDLIVATPAVTPEGARAKAAALVAWAPDYMKPESGCWDYRLLASLLADLTGRAAA